MATDPYQIYERNMSAPASDAFVVTANTDFPRVARGLYVGGSGDVALVTAEDTTVIFRGVLAGTVLPIRAKRVNAAGTTATNLVGLV